MLFKGEPLSTIFITLLIFCQVELTPNLYKKGEAGYDKAELSAMKIYFRRVRHILRRFFVRHLLLVPLHFINNFLVN